MKRYACIATALLTVSAAQTLYAIHLGANDAGDPLPWSRKMEHPLDQPMNDKLDNKSFYMNLGPTGIRAKINQDDPKAFEVMYVFQDTKSPAKGKVNIGDRIIGANGKKFKDPHGFHRKQGGRGWPGPPFELAHAIEDSQGADGKLTLMIQNGNGSASEVALQLKPVGRFADTWPWDCPRSARLRQELCDFLIEQPRKGRIHVRAQYILAMYASGDKRAVPLFEEMGRSIASSRPDYHASGMCTWGWGYQGIFLGEYYNITKDKSVKDAVEALNQCYEIGMDYKSGGFSHRPFPAIERRVADGGPKGYGSMAGPGGLSMLAQSTFKATGLPISERAYSRTHQAYLAGPGQNESGTLAYGFGNGWQNALIRLKTPGSPCKSKEGVGYICPTGMKNIGDIEVEHWYQDGDKWNKKMVPPTGEYSWIKSEADNLLVYETGHYLESENIQQRLVIRPTTLSEPNNSFSNNRKGGGHNAPVGMGALAHYIGNKGNSSWNYLGEHMAIGCAASPQTLWDGHASGEMHAFWGALAPFRAPEKDLRSFLDYTKTWIILSESHDGQGLIDQPFGCQRNSTCSIALNRTAYTHVALMILSVPNRNLLITGADYAQPAASVSYGSVKTPTASRGGSTTPRRSTPPPRPVARAARTLSPERAAILDRSLRATLYKLSDANKLKLIPIRISKSPVPVYLKKAESGGTLTFQVAGGSRVAEAEYSALSMSDRAALAVLVAAINSSSTDAQAMAGVYLEAVGLTAKADTFYTKAGDASRKKLEALFN